jgi:hypothetical protein
VRPKIRQPGPNFFLRRPLPFNYPASKTVPLGWTDSGVTQDIVNWLQHEQSIKNLGQPSATFLSSEIQTASWQFDCTKLLTESENSIATPHPRSLSLARRLQASFRSNATNGTLSRRIRHRQHPSRDSVRATSSTRRLIPLVSNPGTHGWPHARDQVVVVLKPSRSCDSSGRVWNVNSHCRVTVSQSKSPVTHLAADRHLTDHRDVQSSSTRWSRTE